MNIDTLSSGASPAALGSKPVLCGSCPVRRRIRLVDVEPPERPTGQMGAPPAAGPLPKSVPGQPVPVSDVLPPLASKKQPNRRLRLWLAMMAGILALLCLGGVGVALALYDGATKIKRTSPDAVVDNFLGAYLVDRDDKEASLYECKSGGDFQAIAAYRADMLTREKDFSVGIRVSWSSMEVSTQGNTGTVSTNLVKTATDQSGRLSNTWEFRVVDQDGWRVCGATQIS
jgi:hypothetical protein